MKFLLYKASAAYPETEIEDETIAVWIERLRGFPFQRGLENLNRCIDSSRYFPKIADILQGESRESINHRMLQQSTQEQFRLKERWASAGDPPPEGYWERTRRLLEGDR